jgi:hypothetical protein
MEVGLCTFWYLLRVGVARALYAVRIRGLLIP